MIFRDFPLQVLEFSWKKSRTFQEAWEPWSEKISREPWTDSRHRVNYVLHNTTYMTTRQQLKHYQRWSHSQQHESSSAWHSALVPSCPAVRHIHSYQVTWSRRRWLAEARRPGRSVWMSTCLDVAEMPGPLHTASCIFITRINSQSRRQKHSTSSHLLSRLRCSRTRLWVPGPRLVIQKLKAQLQNWLVGKKSLLVFICFTNSNFITKINQKTTTLKNKTQVSKTTSVDTSHSTPCSLLYIYIYISTSPSLQGEQKNKTIVYTYWFDTYWFDTTHYEYSALTI